MKSVIKQPNGSLTRGKLANPFSNIPMSERLRARKSTDLRNNIVVIDEGNGFVRVKPIDESKTF
ncbi:hypothetical protein D3C74_125620 [compost metagenome]